MSRITDGLIRTDAHETDFPMFASRTIAISSAGVVGLVVVLVISGCARSPTPQPDAQGQRNGSRAEVSSAPNVIPEVAKESAAPIAKPPAPTPVAKAPPTKASAPPAQAPPKAVTPSPPAQSAAPKAPPLDLASLEQRLRETKAIGTLTKLTLKNQVDDLLDQFRTYYQGKLRTDLAALRRSYDLLVLKFVSLLQDDDKPLAAAIVASREAIWGILSDPAKFATI